MIRALGWHPASAARPVLDQVTLCLEKDIFMAFWARTDREKRLLRAIF